MGQPVQADDYESYECLLDQARRITGKLLFDNPKEWEQRKYINRLKRQRLYYTYKEPKIVMEIKKKEAKAEQKLEKDLNLFAKLWANKLELHSFALDKIKRAKDYGEEGGFSIELPNVTFADIAGHHRVKYRRLD